MPITRLDRRAGPEGLQMGLHFLSILSIMDNMEDCHESYID